MEKILCAALAGVLLAACAPRPTYEMIPPDTAEGRACAGQCLNALQQCENACRSDQKSCEMLTWAGRTLNPGTSYDECSSSGCLARCEEKHRLCFTTCGGKVTRYLY